MRQLAVRPEIMLEQYRLRRDVRHDRRQVHDGSGELPDWAGQRVPHRRCLQRVDGQYVPPAMQQRQ